tara:strand:+ start:704 stop:817 length:114 start_codon:yes stop_codon:yes gene_type:complete
MPGFETRTHYETIYCSLSAEKIIADMKKHKSIKKGEG